MDRMCGYVSTVALSQREPALTLQRQTGKVHCFQSHQTDTYRWAPTWTVKHTKIKKKHLCFLDVKLIHLFSVVRFCRRSGRLWDTKSARRWSLSGGGGEVCGCGSVSTVPRELQLRSSASVPLPACLPASCSAPRDHGGNPAQGQHTYLGSLSGQAGSLPTAHPPLTGILYVSVCAHGSLKKKEI